MPGRRGSRRCPTPRRPGGDRARSAAGDIDRRSAIASGSLYSPTIARAVWSAATTKSIPSRVKVSSSAAGRRGTQRSCGVRHDNVQVLGEQCERLVVQRRDRPPGRLLDLVGRRRRPRGTTASTTPRITPATLQYSTIHASSVTDSKPWTSMPRKACANAQTTDSLDFKCGAARSSCHAVVATMAL